MWREGSIAMIANSLAMFFSVLSVWLFVRRDNRKASLIDTPASDAGSEIIKVDERPAQKALDVRFESDWSLHFLYATCKSILQSTDNLSLLLRLPNSIFRSSQSAEKLYDSKLERWSYKGSSPIPLSAIQNTAWWRYKSAWTMY